MKNLVLVVLLVALITAAPLLALGASATASGTASLKGSFGAQSSEVSYNITGTLSSDTNTTLSLTASLTATEAGSASINGNFQLTYQGQGLPEASIDYTKTVTVSKGHYESHSHGSLYINLTSLQSAETESLFPLQLPGTGGGGQTPPTPPTPPIPGGNETSLGITAVYLTFTSTTQGYYNGTYGDLTATLHANFNIVGGASIVGLPGNATGTLAAETHTIVNGTKAETTYKVVIAFNSGNQQVDAGLTALVYNYLKMAANKTSGEAQATMNVTSNGTAVVVTGKTEASVTGLVTPGIPGLGRMGHMGGGVPVNLTALTANNTGVPLFYENASATLTVTLKGDVSNGVLTAQGSVTGNIQGINPEALTFYPTEAKLSLTLSNRDYAASVYLKGEGDPATAYAVAKELAIATLHALNCGSSTVTVSLNTDGSVHFYNAETGEDLGTSLQLTCNNLGEIKHIVIAPPNTTIKAEGSGVIHVAVKGKVHHVKLSIATIANAKVVVVDSKKVVVETGKIMLSQPKTLIVKAGGHLVVHVKVHAKAKLNGSLEVEALNKTEADAKAKAYGYTAAGAGVTVNGIEEGTATINLPANKTQGIAILEISHNGEVKLITNYKVEANGSVTFNATSFSTFIVVNANNQPTPTATTTTSQSGQSTTNSQAGTSKTTGQQTSTTSTRPSQSSTPAATAGQSTGQAAGTSANQGGKTSGSNTLTVAAAIIVIIIIAAAAYALKK